MYMNGGVGCYELLRLQKLSCMSLSVHAMVIHTNFKFCSLLTKGWSEKEKQSSFSQRWTAKNIREYSVKLFSQMVILEWIYFKLWWFIQEQWIGRHR